MKETSRTERCSGFYSLVGELPTELPHRISDKRKGRYLTVNLAGSIWEATRLSPLKLPSVPVCCGQLGAGVGDWLADPS